MSARWRRRRRLSRSQRGVVSVVGTLLSLLVFFALFGIFITQYVPLWMTDNEAQLTSQTQASLATLQSNLQLQAALGNPPIYSTSFVMASQGIPLIAQPTGAILSFLPFQTGVFTNVSTTVGPGNGGPFYQNFSLGEVSVFLPNRYFAPQQFEFENGAVVESQGDTHQVMEDAPVFALNQTGSYVTVSVGEFQLYGNATQIITTGTQDLYTHLLFNQTYSSSVSSGPGFSANFVLGTHYPCAWATYLHQTLLASGIAASHYTLTPSTCIASGGTPKVVSLAITGVGSFTLVTAGFSLATGVGVQ